MASLSIQQEEQRIRQRSVLVTLLVALLLAATMFLVVLRDSTPPAGEVQYELAGSIDFGTTTTGSGNNNAATPTPNPNPAPTQNPTTPTANDVEVIEAPNSDQSTPVTNDAPETEPGDQVDNPLIFGGGGGDGNDNEPGDVGDPSASDGTGRMGSDGIYEFGIGELNVQYNVDEEGSLVLKITVGMGGRTTAVDVVSTSGRIVVMKSRIKAALFGKTWKGARPGTTFKVRVNLRQK